MTSSHISGAITTALVHVAVALFVFGLSDRSGCRNAGAERPKLTMTTIEASLAYKSNTRSKQPQKRTRLPQPTAQPDGVSRDENRPVEPDKKKPAETEEDYSKQFEKYRQQRQNNDDDVDIDDDDKNAPRPGGEFNGSEHGFAEVSKGDPYMQELAKDVYSGWEVPTLEQGNGAAIGCVRLTSDGKIIDSQLETKSGNANIDRSVKLALTSLQEQRNKKPVAVPRHLMEITAQWTCFKFNV